MRTIYVDCGEVSQSGPLGIFSCEVQILYAGTVLHTEQAKVRAEVPQYQGDGGAGRDILFFENEEPRRSRFTRSPAWNWWPGTGEGNWYGRAEDLGRACTASPPEGAAFRVSGTHGPSFSGRLLAGREVRELWEPVPELRVYPPRRRQPGRWSWSRWRSCCQRDGRSGRDEDACHHRADERAGPDRH